MQSGRSNGFGDSNVVYCATEKKELGGQRNYTDPI